MNVERGFDGRFERAKWVCPGVDAPTEVPTWFEGAFDTFMTYWFAPLGGLIYGIIWVNW
jgi:hypothetical protein